MIYTASCALKITYYTHYAGSYMFLLLQTYKKTYETKVQKRKELSHVDLFGINAQRQKKKRSDMKFVHLINNKFNGFCRLFFFYYLFFLILENNVICFMS